MIHNTAWIPGHLHLTVATAVTLSFMGISYWLVPHLTGKKLWRPKWAVIQTWLWFIGMIIFSNGMHTLGLLGAPRRTPLGVAPYVLPEWNGRLIQSAVGGAILFVAMYLFIAVIIGTLRGKRAAAGEVPQIPVAQALQDPQSTPAWLDRWVPWLIATVALIVLSYGPQLISQIGNMSLTSPGFKVW